MSFDAALARSLYDHAPLATFVVDVYPDAEADRRFRFAGFNPACQHITGLSDEGSRGKTPCELVPQLSEEAARAIEANYQRCLEAGAPIQYEEQMVLEGRQTHWLTSLAPQFDSDGSVCRLVGMSDEITSYKRLEACLAAEQDEQKQFTRRLRHLHRLATTRHPSATNLYSDYLTTGCDMFGLSLGIISHIDGDTYTVEASVSEDEAFPHGASFDVQDTLCAEVATQCATVQYHDLSRISRLQQHPVYVDGGLRAYISTPIYVNDEIYGTLNFSSSEARSKPFTEQDVELMELMADGIGHYLELERAQRAARAARRQVEAARDEAEAASRAKSSFLSTMSHEIRTPLTGVLGFASLLRSDAALPPQARHYADVIGRSGKQLVALVNDVLDIAKIEAGALSLHPEPTDLTPLVRHSLELHAALAETQSVEVCYEIQSGVPAQVIVDGRRVQQILGNLVSNAVKFTRDGNVAVRLAATPLSADRARLCFEVEDTGSGIAPEALPHVFDSFYQADGSTARSGTGLGLAICQKLVQAMGGTIEADSRLGHGTTISFTLEVEVEARRQVVVAARRELPLAGRRALVLDAHGPSRELLQTLLRQWEIEVATATTGGEALHLIAADGPFDVALFENSLSGETGVGVAQQLAARGTELPVILVSSLDEDVAASEPAICTMLRKPLDVHSLRRALRKALVPPSRRAPHEQMPAPVPLPASLLTATGVLPAPSLFSRPSVDPLVPAVVAAECEAQRHAPRVIVAEDEPTNRDLIQLFLSGLGVQPDFAVNGADLLDKLGEDPGYDLIFMDMMMPVMDGMEAARTVIERYGDDRPRMVALTARALQEDRQRILLGGLDGFIAKPFSRSDLREALDATPVRTRETTIPLEPVASA